MNTWVIVVLVSYIVLMVGLTIWVIRRSARKKKFDERPRYERGNANSDWERAAEKSLEWSRKRRNKGGN